MTPPLVRRALAEYCGTAFLVAVVVGSGVAAAKLSPNDTGLQLLENAAATAAGLVALILAFGPVSGAHLNPVVSLAAPSSADSTPESSPPMSPPRSPGRSPDRSWRT